MAVALTLTDEQVAAVKAAGDGAPAAPALVHPLSTLTSAAYADMGIGTPWQKKMGDWTDAAGIFNGPTPTLTASGKNVTVDITAIPGDILLQGAYRATSVVIDGHDAGAYFTDPGMNHVGLIPAVAVGAPNHTAQPIIVPNSGGKSLTLVSSSSAFRLDALAPPVASVPPPLAGYTPPNILRIDPTSFDAVVIPGSVPAASTPQNRCFLGAVTYETDHGVPFAKAHCATTYYPTTGYGRVARCDYPITPVPELYVAYLLYISDRVAYACRDGVKLSGMGGDEGRWNIGEHINRYSQQYINSKNYPILGLRDYYYSAEATSGQGPGNGQNSPFNFGYLRSPGWTLIEHGSRANTFNADGTANKDGFKRTWINGNLVEDRAIQWFTNSASRWHAMSLQIYNGGTSSFGEDCWYGIGPFMASTKHIGVDPAFEPLLA